jgi:hypothetical protein
MKELITKATIPKIIITVSMLLFSFIVLQLIFVPKMYAAVPLTPNPIGQIPQTMYEYFEKADTYRQTPAFNRWISPEGQPSTTSITVPYGTPSIRLAYHEAGAVGFSGNTFVSSTKFAVRDASATNPGSIDIGIGSEYALNFNNNPGTYSQLTIPFNYAPNGGFTQSGWYTVTLGVKLANQFSDGIWRCVADGADTNAFQWAFDRVPGIPGCPRSEASASFYVEVSGLLGNLDKADCEEIAGWAFDRDRPNDSIEVHIYRIVNGVVVDGRSGIWANASRQDVNNAYGIGGNHGFWWPLPNEWKDGQTATYQAYAINIPGTPGSNTFIGALEVQACVDTTTFSTQLEAYCDANAGRNTGRVYVSVKNNGPDRSKSLTVTWYTEVNGVRTNRNVPENPLTLNPGEKKDWAVDVSLDIGDNLMGGITVSPGSSNNGSLGPQNSLPCTGPNIRYKQPYFRAYGGDVVVGRDVIDQSNCPAVSNASIRAFTKEISPNQWAGAGSQFAARATDIIDGFMSASMHSGAGAANRRAPNSLSFGSFVSDSGVMRPISFPAEKPGNDQTAHFRCIPDYVDFAQEYEGTQTLPAPAELNGETIDSGIKVVFVDGDVTITDNITIKSTGWTSLNEIPRFFLIATGNITIRSGVSVLDGVYVSGGTITTCQAASMEDCNTKLTVNGSMISKNINLLRTAGDLGTAIANEGPDADIAEVFNFTPETLLALPNPNPDTIDPLDALVGLPPVF